MGKAIHDEPVDFEEARRVARLVAQLGKGMKDSVPPDIADAFHLQLKAVRVSSSKLSTRNSAFDVVDPVYNKRATAARKALNEYECD
ncbi:hypothetical protein [Nonomuraea sp. SYSU D8015]|uniref:hypothetical protein n=1 Tax=Nonomuraea sp. SYSU D8015 TaxID=2593644 RepID=UPI001660E68B|nr:hypothetical protein [Nonomuraea sp. SYSU D8015]